MGFALKQHQRAWALSQDIREVTWTFDPLVRANARFNLVKLGAVAVAFFEDFYGEMDDGVNAGDRGDRCAIRWASTAPGWSPPAMAGGPSLTSRGRPGAGGPVLLAVGPGEAPAVMNAYEALVGSDPVVCQVPADIVALCAADAGKARAWRDALAETMGRAMEAGFVAGSITRDGWYLLTRSDDEEAGG